MGSRVVAHDNGKGKRLSYRRGIRASRLDGADAIEFRPGRRYGLDRLDRGSNLFNERHLGIRGFLDPDRLRRHWRCGFQLARSCGFRFFPVFDCSFRLFLLLNGNYKLFRDKAAT